MLAGASFGGVACSDFGTDPSEAVAIEFDPPLLPAIVAGDELRDSLGAPIALAARVFNADNELITGAPIRFIALDTGVVTVDSVTGRVIGIRAGEAGVIASIGGLQSGRLTLRVTLRPDTAVALDSLRDTLHYSFGSPALNEDTLRVFVGHDTVIAGTDTSVAVPHYLVRYRIVEPAGLPAADTAGTVLVDENRRASTVDTTSQSGIALRILRIARRAPIPDSVVVEAVVSRPDATPVPGSPIRYTIIVVTGQTPVAGRGPSPQ